jgi:hypothetical protein
VRKILGVGEGKSVGELEKETLMKTGKTVGRLDINSVKCVGEVCWKVRLVYIDMIDIV